MNRRALVLLAAMGSLAAQQLDDRDQALERLTQELRERPTARAYADRGRLYFQLAQIKESVADFDSAIKLEPRTAPYLWERGIALYYAKRFDDGRKQFESHRLVNPNDVENSVWWYLCVARAGQATPEQLKKAKTSLLPIQNDPRVPMMQIYSLFRGDGSVDVVFAAAQAGSPSKDELRNQMFYANLYVGLYFEAQGDAKQARNYIGQAAGKFSVDHYMGDVARVHMRLRRK
jgi:lipoprotein NlpI